jgi:hypothetical protein
MQENHTPSTGSDAVKPILDKQHEFHPMNAGLSSCKVLAARHLHQTYNLKKDHPITLAALQWNQNLHITGFPWFLSQAKNDPYPYPTTAKISWDTGRHSGRGQSKGHADNQHLHRARCGCAATSQQGDL